MTTKTYCGTCGFESSGAAADATTVPGAGWVAPGVGTGAPGSRRVPRSKGWLAAYTVAALIGFSALGNAFDPSAPTGTPIATIDHTPLSIASDARERFEGGIGSTAWSALFFVSDRITLRWSASASSKGDCRVAWRIEPTDGDVINSTIRVSAGDSEQGNRRYDTAFTDAALVVDSSCGLWKMSMEGHEAAPQPISGGGGNCDPSYPDVCIPPYPSDLDCGDVDARRFTVVGSDPHGFDGDIDGIDGYATRRPTETAVVVLEPRDWIRSAFAQLPQDYHRADRGGWTEAEGCPDRSSSQVSH